MVARLQQVLTDKEAAFRSGAENRSLSLRRILARRFAAGTADQVHLERDLLRIGKDLGTVRAFLSLAEANKKARGVGTRSPNSRSPTRTTASAKPPTARPR